jgi:hypothetical protein
MGPQCPDGTGKEPMAIFPPNPFLKQRQIFNRKEKTNESNMRERMGISIVKSVS